MRLTVFFTLLALTIAIVVTVLNAAPEKAVKQPVLTVVTAGVEGLNSPSSVDKLQTWLGKQKGIFEVKVIMKPQQVTAKLDEKVISASKFINLINEQGRKTEPKAPYTAKLVVYVDAPMCADQPKMCGACFTEIPKTLKSVKGVNGVTLDESGKVATIAFDAKAGVTTAAITEGLKTSKFNFIVSFAPPVAEGEKDAAATTGGDDCCGMGDDMDHGGMNHGENCDMGDEAGGETSGGSCPMMSGQ